MEVPHHPDADDSEARSTPAAGSRASWLVLGLIVSLIAVVVVLHLAGVVGPG